MKDKNITISLSEYRDLLLKERPNDNDKWLVEKIKNFVAQKCKLNRECSEIEVKDSWNFGSELLKFIKIADFEFYETIVKKCYDIEISKEETKLRIEKMKELNKEKQKSE